jgi:Domain of Unknown Function (DUF1080)
MHLSTGIPKTTCLFVTVAATLLAPACEAATPIELFNGEDLSGWRVVLDDPTIGADKAWKIDEGVLRATAVGKGYIRTEMQYADYKFHVEWRWPKGPGNSGVVLNIVNGDRVWPKGFEAQLKADHAGDIVMFADARGARAAAGETPGEATTTRFERIGPSREKPVGEWNSYDIVVSGGAITLNVNGEEVNHLTGAAPNAGYIALQTEGTPIAFRNITLTPLAAGAK